MMSTRREFLQHSAALIGGFALAGLACHLSEVSKPTCRIYERTI